VKRRQFISLIGGAAASWPLAARGQQPATLPTVGFLGAATPAVASPWLAAFVQRLRELGWVEGRNVTIEVRWAEGRGDRAAEIAAEFVRLKVNIIATWATAPALAAKSATSTIPIVFALATDPIGSGLVASLARPGGNTTGFTLSEYGLSGKWLELLKEIAPRVTRTAVLRDPVAVGIGQFAAIQAVAPSLQVDLSPIDVREAGEIERAITAFADRPNGALIVTAASFATIHRELIIALARRHQLPAVYPFGYYVASGGLISYGPDAIDLYHRAASYVDRILKGESPADLPVQHPTKYQLAINLKTAKALGLEIPPTLLARADEVIE
jgi:putative tryptophan/tyrosine transport system substrate-binding protein